MPWQSRQERAHVLKVDHGTGLVLCLLWTQGRAENEIRFHIPEFPPYAYVDSNEVEGIGVRLVDRIIAEAGLNYTIRLVPNYGRAVAHIRKGISDGFFLASQNRERNEAAVFSRPVVPNRWCWFLPVESVLNPHSPRVKGVLRVGTHLNTNTHKWLLGHRFNVTGTPTRIESLLEKLSLNRINAIFLAELVFYDAVERAGRDPRVYQWVVQAEKDFGIYISKLYLDENPGAMERNNGAIALLGAGGDK